MQKLWASCEQVVNLAKTNILGVCCMVHAVHEKAMKKSWISHEQFQNKSRVLAHEEAMSKPFGSHEQVMNKLWTIQDSCVVNK